MNPAARFSVQEAFSVVLAGMIGGLVTLISCISFAALIFTGALAPYIGLGINMALVTSLVAGGLIALTSACRPLVAMPDDDTAPVLALMVALLVNSFPAGTSPGTVLVSALGVLAIATLFTGITLFVLGVFHLGSLVRFLPYSVMGGYFAGVGLLLIQGALRVVTGLPLISGPDMLALFHAEVVLQCLPALAAAVGIHYGLRWLHRGLAMPLTIALLVVLYYLGAWWLGWSPQALMAAGHLAGPFPDTEATLLNPVLVQRAADIDWGVLLDNGSSVGTIIMLSAISLMLTASGLSLLQREDVDINHELKVAGFANTLSGLSGGLLALPSLTMTELTMKVGAPRRRLVGVVVAVFCGIALFFAMDLIAWFPKSVLAGLLIFLGWSFLDRWLVKARRQLPALEYAVVVGIVVVVMLAGFLPGVFVGLVSAILLFVINYSRINVVRYSLTGRQRRSNVERNASEAAYLRDCGEQVLILKLQGYLFFGTAAALNKRIEQRLHDQAQSRLAYVALDFAHVSGMDSSAALSFMKLAQEATRWDFFLLLTGMSESMQEQLRNNWIDRENTSYVQLLPDLDRGVEWIEERMLREGALQHDHEGIREQLARYLPLEADRERLLSYLEYRQVASGEVLARQDEVADEMYLLDDCTASVFLATGSNRLHRIRRAGTGTVFGEVAFYLGTPRTATVIVDTAGGVFVLNREMNARLESEQPQLASALHRFLLGVIIQRLQLTTQTLQAVLS